MNDKKLIKIGLVCGLLTAIGGLLLPIHLEQVKETCAIPTEEHIKIAESWNKQSTADVTPERVCRGQSAHIGFGIFALMLFPWLGLGLIVAECRDKPQQKLRDDNYPDYSYRNTVDPKYWDKQ